MLADVAEKYKQERNEALNLLKQNNISVPSTKITSFFRPLKPSNFDAKQSSKSAQVGNKSERTLRDHTKHILDDIEMLTAGDVKKQDALAKAIMSRISGKKALGDNTDEGWSLIQESLKHFFSSLHQKYK